MRLLLIAALSLLSFLSPAAAQTFADGQCSLEHPVTDGAVQFEVCPLISTDDGLLQNNPPYFGARLNQDVDLDTTPIFAHGICRYVDARGTTADMFIPFKTDAEWNAFLAAAPAGVHFAQCCLPGPLHVRDLPPVTKGTSEVCASGWKLEGLVSSTNFNELVAVPNGQDGDSTFSMAPGVQEDADYPITQLPIERDDLAKMLPKGARSSQNYVAKYSCAVTTANSVSTRVQLVPFNMQCANAKWTATDSICTSGPIAQFTDACPAGSTGTITKQLVRSCPGGEIAVEELTNTCVTDPASNPQTQTLAAGLSSNTPTSCSAPANICPAGVTPSCTTKDGACICTCSGATCAANTDLGITDLGITDSACPSGQTGTIHTHMFRTCSMQGNACVCGLAATEEDDCKAVQKNCPAPKEICSQTRKCPSGQTGQIVVKTIRVCESKNNQCVCHDENTEVSNTCKKICKPSEKCDTKACPAGYTGNIQVTTKHICPEDKDVVTEKNNCHKTCTPSERCETKQCPAGQTGSITVTTKHICPEDKDVVTEENKCTGCPASTDLGTETQACPAGQVGSVIVHKKKLCEVKDNQCVCHEEQTQETACEVCPAATDLGTLSKQCPAGQTGEIVVHRRSLCSVQNNACVCHEEQTEENKCNSCPASTDQGTTTKQCPYGQTGSILVHKVKVCKVQNNQCVCDTTETEENKCTKTCTPSERCDTKQCPYGQTGNIQVTTKHICPEDKDVVTEKNNCHQACTPSQHSETLSCPAGQTGSIIRTTTHVCPDDKDVVTEENTCKSICDTVKTQDDTFEVHTRRSVYCAGGVNLDTRLVGSSSNGQLVHATVFDNDHVPPGADISDFTHSTTTSITGAGSALSSSGWGGIFGSLLGRAASPDLAGAVAITYNGNGIFHVKPTKTCNVRGNSGTIEGDFSYTLSNDCSRCSGHVHFKIVIQSSPLVLDLDGDGLSVYSMQNSPAHFDIDGDGKPDHTAWVGPREAFLVRDRNGDGVINNRDEMFGDTDSFDNGFSNLASLDANKDGVIDVKDPVFASLRLWLDANGNGVTDAGELHTLPELNVASIGVNPEAIGRVINSQTVSHEASFTTTDGKAGKVYDIWFDAE